MLPGIFTFLYIEFVKNIRIGFKIRENKQNVSPKSL